MKSIFFISGQSTQKVGYWSGIPYFSKRALEKTYHVLEINPGEVWLNRTFVKLFSLLKRRLRIRYNYQHSFMSSIVTLPTTLIRLNRHFNTKNNIILGEAVSSEIPFIPKKFKIIIFADATFDLLEGYSYYANLWLFSKNESRYIDRLSLQRADKIIFTSYWAKNAAVHDLGINADKISVCRFGANIPDRFAYEMIESRCNSKELQFLFPSTDWKRKGGDKAIEFLELLSHQSKYKIRLVTFGVAPEGTHSEHICIDTIGWLDKSITDDQNTIIKHYAQADFLILPTEADCTPVAISESFCYGLPVIATDVGGISEMIKPEEDGYLIKHESEMDVLTSEINRVAKTQEYQTMCYAARKKYEESYNWDAWVKHVEDLVAQLS